MPNASIHLDQLNLVSRDLEATLAFYRLLGIEIPEDAIWRTASGPHHVDIQPEAGASVDFDSPALAAVYNAGFDPADPQARTLIGFGVDTRDAVDARYAALTRAGYLGLQKPYDTFFGARYAVVRDPDGRSVGIMSPIDPARKSAPPEI